MNKHSNVGKQVFPKGKSTLPQCKRIVNLISRTGELLVEEELLEVEE